MATPTAGYPGGTSKPKPVRNKKALAQQSAAKKREGTLVAYVAHVGKMSQAAAQKEVDKARQFSVSDAEVRQSVERGAVKTYLLDHNLWSGRGSLDDAISGFKASHGLGSGSAIDKNTVAFVVDGKAPASAAKPAVTSQAVAPAKSVVGPSKAQAAKSGQANSPTQIPNASGSVPASTGVSTPITSVDDFMARIGGVESGNPNAVNPDSGAHGKYQIMPANWPSWAKEAGVDPNDQSGAAQDKVARFKMNQYYNDLGSWDAVAVAWYAGESTARAYLKNPSDPRWNQKQGGGKYPSINDYVHKVSGSSATGGGGATATSPTGIAAPKPYTPSSTDVGLASAFGGLAVLSDIPEIKAIIDKANAAHKAGQDLSQDAIDALVHSTNWYKTRNDAAVNWAVEQRTRPRNAAQELDDLTRSLQQNAVTIGFTLDDKRARTLATNMLNMGMDAAQQANALKAEFHFDPTHAQGQAATELATLKATAKSYFVQISDQALSSWVDGIVHGTMTEDSFDQYIKAQAKSQFPQMGAAIDAGLTMSQYADPYVTMAAKQLNIDPNSIDMTDPKWLAPLMQTDPKTGQRVAMNLDQWQTTLRTDPKYGWNQTVGAQNMAADFGAQLERAMGAIK